MVNPNSAGLRRRPLPVAEKATLVWRTEKVRGTVVVTRGGGR